LIFQKSFKKSTAPTTKKHPPARSGAPRPRLCVPRPHAVVQNGIFVPPPVSQPGVGQKCRFGPCGPTSGSEVGLCGGSYGPVFATDLCGPYSRSPKNPALQLFQKSSKSASTTPQRPIYDPAEADLEHFWNCWSAGFLGERLYYPSSGAARYREALFFTPERFWRGTSALSFQTGSMATKIGGPYRPVGPRTGRLRVHMAKNSTCPTGKISWISNLLKWPRSDTHRRNIDVCRLQVDDFLE